MFHMNYNRAPSLRSWLSVHAHPFENVFELFHIKSSLKPGLHIVLMVVSTVVNIFLTLFQAVLIHVDTLITTSQA